MLYKNDSDHEFSQESQGEIDNKGEDLSMSDNDSEISTEIEIENEKDLIDDSSGGFYDHKESVYCLDMSPVDEDIIVSGGGDDVAYIWRISTRERLCKLTGHKDSVTVSSFSYDGEYVATGGMDGQILIWRYKNNGELVTTLEGGDEILWVQWHPKGNILLSGSNDANVWMWKIPSGNVLQLFSFHKKPVNAGSFTPDGKKIVTASEDGSLIIWDPKNASIIHKITSSDSRFDCGGLTCLAYNKEGTVVAVGGISGKVKIISLISGALLENLNEQKESIESISYCDVLPIIACASIDGTVALYDTFTYKLRNVLAHDGAVISLTFISNTPYLITASTDRTIRRWDVRTGKCLKQCFGHRDSILCMCSSLDGKTIISGGDDKSILVFKMTS
ncbi:hypothetical protein PNEG_03460 [Pneumocystis murina B123]|uniref:WDR36/Utp21 N-terminal domain-containing protein n=1 Tax=Pneumocystis murina (strain B123) TaxID=1069680 RepID=M7NHI2_PNEMU|nr:hypothetical protein PNEG_03460 [Pneumocystis murina B123]EMR08018.1 hypothetical protein PNEG_03460 [Pneumocystis murina B123]